MVHFLETTSFLVMSCHVCRTDLTSWGKHCFHFQPQLHNVCTFIQSQSSKDCSSLPLKKRGLGTSQSTDSKRVRAEGAGCSLSYCVTQSDVICKQEGLLVSRSLSHAAVTNVRGQHPPVLLGSKGPCSWDVQVTLCQFQKEYAAGPWIDKGEKTRKSNSLSLYVSYSQLWFSRT